MQFRFADLKLERLYTDQSHSSGYGVNVVRGFRKVMGVIENAIDERDLYALKSLHYEKVKGESSPPAFVTAEPTVQAYRRAGED